MEDWKREEANTILWRLDESRLVLDEIMPEEDADKAFDLLSDAMDIIKKYAGD